MNRTLKTLIFWMVIVVSAFLLWQSVRSGANEKSAPEISYSQFLSQIANNEISKVTIAGSVVHGYDAKGASFRVIAPPNQSVMLESLQEHGAEIWFKETPEQGWSNWIMNLLPLVLLAALWFFMIRQMKTASQARAVAQRVSGSTSSPESQPRFGP
jgi:cell division protease FtsH